LWWRHEALHRRALLGDFGRFAEQIRPERDALEAAFRARIEAVIDADATLREEAVAQCWREADEAQTRWHEQVQPTMAAHDARYTGLWRTMNELAGL
jgi:hypothetical protein